MSEPRNPREFFIHECDILASRVDIDYIIPEELKQLLEENAQIKLPDIDAYTMPFGKHKGTLIREVPKDYIKWFSTQEIKDKDLKYCVDKIMAGE